MHDLTVSIVVFKTTYDQLKHTIGSVLGSGLDLLLIIIDHSPDNSIVCQLPQDPRLKYYHHPENPGFGAGHNKAMKEAVSTSRYHLVLNPDVNFNPTILCEMLAFLDRENGIGLLSPLVHYPSGEVQHLCKLLPTPVDAVLRRLLPGSYWVKQRNHRYELRDFDYNTIMDVPYLSGCFMLMRTSILKEVGFFDERFFMYYEDTDLSRRFHQSSRTVFYPFAMITHHFAKGSYRNYGLLVEHIKSAIRYFNKWGYFFDPERTAINKKILRHKNRSA